MKILLLIVDMQNDFCNPEGALYVKGAEGDVARLGKFIKDRSDRIDHIILTQDNHQVIDISHPGFWEDSNGNPPPPFTVISTEDVLNGVWKPRYEKNKAVTYIEMLEKQGEFAHVVWPEHCIIGSYGAAIVNEVMEPVKAWARKGNFFETVIKGTNPLTEHFGALRANIPIKNSPETQLNKDLIIKLQYYNTILLAGEARSHCVANTVKQMLDIDGIVRKLVILEDCMSDVTGFESLSVPIFEKARAEGAKFISSTDLFQF